MKGSCTDKYIKLPYFTIQPFLDFIQGTTYLTVFLKDLTNTKNSNGISKFLWLLDMPFIVAAIDGTIGKFGYGYF